jgi:hypothetical protein
MHPLSTALFLLGYGLALPIAFRLVGVVARQHRVALAGHQLGIGIALVGWLLRGSITAAALHGLWLAIARIWFALGRPDHGSVPASES